MFSFFKKRQQSRETFEHFLAGMSLARPHASLEDVLDAYIEKYSLKIQHSFDEPKIITEKRTKLEILKKSVFGNPEHCPDPQIATYITTLQGVVTMYEMLSPEGRVNMKENENKG